MIAIEGVGRRFGGGRTLLLRRKPQVHALRGIDLQVHRGETLGIVGESGCGKSTLARLLVGLDRATSGRILLDGEDLGAMARRNRRAVARRVQYVFQDPVSSLNPRHTIRQVLEAPLKYLLGMPARERASRLVELLGEVGLPPEHLSRYPHEFSGGQAQRIGIARALAARPQILVLDEPVSALDVSIQAQVLWLLGDLKAAHDLTFVFISHDLAVIENVCDRVAVMYFGRIVEEAPAAELFRAPRHPYTRLLLDSAPVPGRRIVASADAAAELPDPLHPPGGCAFAPRCPRATDHCRRHDPALEAIQPERRVACHYPLEGSSGGVQRSPIT